MVQKYRRSIKNYFEDFLLSRIMIGLINNISSVVERLKITSNDSFMAKIVVIYIW